MWGHANANFGAPYFRFPSRISGGAKASLQLTHKQTVLHSGQLEIIITVYVSYFNNMQRKRLLYFVNVDIEMNVYFNKLFGNNVNSPEI